MYTPAPLLKVQHCTCTHMSRKEKVSTSDKDMIPSCFLFSQFLRCGFRLHPHEALITFLENDYRITRVLPVQQTLVSSSVRSLIGFRCGHVPLCRLQCQSDDHVHRAVASPAFYQSYSKAARARERTAVVNRAHRCPRARYKVLHWAPTCCLQQEANIRELSSALKRY